MGMLVALKLFKPVLKNASKMTTPVQELKSAGMQAGKTESTIGDVVELSTKGKSAESITKRLFSSFEEFKESALNRLRANRNGVPEKLFADVEKSAASNEFELTKAIKEYYSKLNECKTLEEVALIYPEFAHLNVDLANELRMLIKSSIPESLCKEALRLPTKEQQLNYIVKYMDKVTNKCVKGWQSYKDILRIQRETAVEIVNGTYTGSADAKTGLKFFANKEPLRFYLLDKKDRDAVIISYLKQYYLEGKSVQNVIPEIARGRSMSPQILNIKGLHWANPASGNFRAAVTSIEKEANEYKALSQLTKGEINSAVMKRSWTTSGLRLDMANETKYGKGWTYLRSILNKRKGMVNDASSSDKMIERYLLNRFKANNRNVTEKNPFQRFENAETDKTVNAQRFINNMYHTSEITLNDRIILKSPEFQAFKSEFDIDGMKESIQKVEDIYVKLFFKRFWTDARKEKFGSALRANFGTAQENIKVNDSILMQAMTEAFV